MLLLVPDLLVADSSSFPVPNGGSAPTTILTLVALVLAIYCGGSGLATPPPSPEEPGTSRAQRLLLALAWFIAFLAFSASDAVLSAEKRREEMRRMVEGARGAPAPTSPSPEAR